MVVHPGQTEIASTRLTVSMYFWSLGDGFACIDSNDAFDPRE
jgi:hypothetical protein